MSPIELKDGRSRYVPIIQPFRMLALILGACGVVAVVAIVTGERATRAPSSGRRLPWR